MKIKIFYGEETNNSEDFEIKDFNDEDNPKKEDLKNFSKKKEEIKNNSDSKKVFLYRDANNNEIKKPSLAEQEIGEKTTQPDFVLSEKYQMFSSELLRLSLAGIAVFGFLIQYLKLFNSGFIVKLLVGLSVIALIVSAGFALFHRYISTDSLSYLIAYLRAEKLYKDKQKSFTKEQRFLLAFQSYEESNHYRDLLRQCKKYLGFSIAALAIGIVFLASGLSIMLFTEKQDAVKSKEPIVIELR